MENVHKDVEELKNKYKDYLNLLPRIKQFNKEHEDNFNEMYFGFTITGEVAISYLSHLVTSLMFFNKDSWKPHNGVQYAIIKNTIPYLVGVYDNILKGHYHIASTLNRACLDNLIRIYFISFHQEEYAGIYGIKGKKEVEQKVNKKLPNFNVKNFLEKELDNRFVNIYEFLSFEAHGNMFNIMKDIDDIHKEQYDIGIDFQGAIDFSYNMNILIKIIYGFLKFIEGVLISGIDISKSDKINQLEELTRIHLKNTISETKDIINFLNNYLEKIKGENGDSKNINKEINETTILVIEKELGKQ